MKKFTTVGLGELLWDLLPKGRQLGGAPANFAYMTSLLGDDGIVASRIGADNLGDEAVRRLESLGVNTLFIQRDAAYRTGVANVSVDSKGQPSFQIAQPVAWDYFEWTPSWQSLAQKADAVCFGSLAQRSPQSREATRFFLQAIRPTAARVFDVNLRQSFYSREILADSAKSANIIKLNHEELPAVARLLGFPLQDETSASQWLLSTFRLQLVCVTRGAAGSLLISEHSVHEHPGLPVQVADTVGAGDAFTAALIYHFLRGHALSAMNEAANRMGSWVASQTGATPAPDETRLASIRAAAE